MPPHTPLLDTISSPADLRGLGLPELRQVADELRAETIDAVSVTGGHLGAGLGVVELTVALHAVFETPDDILIWDVGHQAYPHKILTGRRDRIRTLRQGDGLSGFTKRSESVYDPFGTAHASTSISAALGFCVSRDQQHRDNKVVAVIGDGAMSAGMAYEAMNNAAEATRGQLTVILNDNDMSIAPPVGGMSAYLAGLVSGRSYQSFRKLGRSVASALPRPLQEAARKAEEYARGMATGGTFFEELGFYYVGPIDGHNMDHLVAVLKNVREIKDKPVLVHVVTQKGKGYAPAENAADKYHGVVRFDVVTGEQSKAKSNAPSYTKVFGTELTKRAERDDRIVAITAAMPSGTGVDILAKRFPDRVFDVGIAEQHAVTFAAGLAADGMRPFCAIYSTFLQRGYDQVVHDVAIQSLPVRFAIDRAGLVGADGATHAGPGPAPGDRPRPHRAGGHGAGHPVPRHPAGGVPEGRRPAGLPGPVGHGGRCPLCQAPGRGPDPAPGAGARGPDHRRGRGHGRVRGLRPPAAGQQGGAGPGPEGPDPGAARPLPGP